MLKQQRINKSFDDLISEKDLLEKMNIKKKTLSNKRVGNGGESPLKEGIHWFKFGGSRVYSKLALLKFLNIPIDEE